MFLFCMNIGVHNWRYAAWKENKILNFLYKVPLITRVKTTNTKVGRKYARNEGLS